MGKRGKRKRTNNKMNQIKQRDRIKKKEKMKIAINADDPTPDPADLPTDLTDPSSRNWADLPEPLLVSILDRLYSATYVLAFSATCRPWRSAAASAPRRAPPLLLAPAVVHPDRCNPRWVGPPSCRLQNPTAANRSYLSPISSKTLAKSCIGCSHAHLIFVADGKYAVLANAFTGREVRSPNFPSGSFHFSVGILTAPLASASCLVLVVAHNIKTDVFSILSWRPGGGEWSELKLTYSPKIMSLVVFKGQVFGLDSLYRLILVEFGPQMSWRLLEAQLSTGQFLYHNYGRFGEHLVECNGELLLVLFVPTGKFWAPGPPKIEVYRLDMARSVWVKKEGLGDWCLFIDAVGSCPFLCPDPARWGGRRNCVYIAGPGYEWWSVFPLDGEAVDTTDESPLNSRCMPLPSWPSPVWVYPSMLL